MQKTARRLALPLIAAAAIMGGATFAAAPANAQIYIGTGPGYHHHHDWRWRHHRWGGGHCRVVVRSFWRHGHRVVVRRRECF